MERPRVLLNAAPSLDGKLAPVARFRPPGTFHMSRGTEDHRRMRALRDHADAIVIGASNARLDDPDLAVDGDARKRRKAEHRGEPLRVLVTRRGEGLSTKLKVFDGSLGGPTIVAHAATMPEETRAELAAHAELVELGAEHVEMKSLLLWLKKEHHCKVVLSEGGGVLNAALFAARAVDEVYLTLVPRFLGGAGAPSLVEGSGLDLERAPRVELASHEVKDGELFLRYTLDWHEGGRGAKEP